MQESLDNVVVATKALCDLVTDLKSDNIELSASDVQTIISVIADLSAIIK